MKPSAPDLITLTLRLLTCLALVACVPLAFGQREVKSSSSAQNTISVSQYRAPKRARLQLKKVMALLHANKEVEAREQLDILVLDFPDYPEGLSLRALIKLWQDENESALEDFEHALRIDPDLVSARFGAGVVLNRLGLFDDASKALERCLQLAPTSSSCEFELAKSYLGIPDFAKSLVHINRSAALAKDHSDSSLVSLVRGYALVGLKQYELGASELQRYLLAQPDGQFSEKARAMILRVESLKQKDVEALAKSAPSPPPSNPF